MRTRVTTTTYRELMRHSARNWLFQKIFRGCGDKPASCIFLKQRRTTRLQVSYLSLSLLSSLLSPLPSPLVRQRGVPKAPRPEAPSLKTQRPHGGAEGVTSPLCSLIRKQTPQRRASLPHGLHLAHRYTGASSLFPRAIRARLLTRRLHACVRVLRD